MRPRQREAAKSDDLFRARLEQIIDMKHELVQLAGKIDWAWIDSQITPLYSAKSAARATAGLGSEGRARAGRRSVGARQRRRPPGAGSMRGSGR